MGKYKKQVRAQRKYAHKAYIPPGCKNDTAPEPPEAETTPAPPLLLKTQRPVNDILDVVSFQNGIHNHQEEMRRRVPRVLLERIEPAGGLLGRAASVPVRPPAIEPPLPPPSPPPLLPPPAPPPFSTSSSTSRRLNSRPNIKPRKITPARSISSLQLRGRRILRNINKKPSGRNNGNNKKSNRGVIPAIENINRQESDTEDNCPLTYFAIQRRKKKKPGPKAKRKRAPKKTGGQLPTLEEAGPSRNIDEETESFHLEYDSASLSKNSDTGRHSFKIHHSIDLSDLVLPDDLLEEFENQNEQLELGMSNETLQRNPLSEFLVNIFDWTDPAEQADFCVPAARENENIASPTDSISRVQEWLTNNEEEKPTPQEEKSTSQEEKSTSQEEKSTSQEEKSTSQEDFNFKFPYIPYWRTGNAAASTISCLASRNNANILSFQERELRKKCITWNHEKFSAVMTDRSAVTLFCGKCSRCKVIFKTCKNKIDPNIDVYDFRTNIDEELCDNNDSFCTLMSNITKETDYITVLQQHMTDTGKKIMKVALLLKEKNGIDTCFSATEQQLLAEVIGVLTDCNAARTRRLQSCDDMPTSSKRQRHYETSSCVTVRSIDPTPLPQSPKFCPTEEEFAQGPIIYSSKMLAKYPKTSLCGVKPPCNFKPTAMLNENPVNFNIVNIYTHRMLTRWGKATRELTAIRSIQGSNIQRSPLFEGLEVDLVKLFNTVQEAGGFESCQHNMEKWQSVANSMKLVCRNKYAKLENIYLKYLLDYNTLTSDEREKVIEDVQKAWTDREMKAVARAQQPLWRQERMRAGSPLEDSEVTSHLETVCAEAEECVTPGRKININIFKKLAQQVQMNFFPDTNEPTPEQVEREFWSIVMAADAHVCVHSASVDAAEHSSGFPSDRNNPYGNHPWNLKRLRSSSANLLSHLGPCLGVSSSSIHYGMAFATSCWHMDPTSIPWIEYLHEGPPKIWYSISADQQTNFRAAAEALCPWAVLNKDIWLPSDILMIPPNLLRTYGVTVKRHVQNAGEFIIVYPNTYCANINTGFTISEGVYFAPHKWINDIERIFTNLRDSCEPSLFSMEKLLIAMAKNERTPKSILQRVHTVLTSLLRAELYYRQRLVDRNIELMTPETFLGQNQRAKISWQIQQNGECAYCRRHLYLSRVVGVVDTGLCSMHGVSLFECAVARREQLTNVYCILMVSNVEIYNIINTLKQRMVGSVNTAV